MDDRRENRHISRLKSLLCERQISRRTVLENATLLGLSAGAAEAQPVSEKPRASRRCGSSRRRLWK